jgi:hypothetical protein
MTNTPGFTAETALLGRSGGYPLTARSVDTDRVIQPASFMGGLSCLKFIFKCTAPNKCGWHTTVGHVNPMTGRCE